MLSHLKNISSKRVITYLEIFTVTLLLIGLDHIVPSVQTSVGVSAVEIKQNDHRDLILTLHEKKMLDIFKAKVVHRLPDACMKKDFYLIKWLRAAQLNTKKAEIMIMENMKWREDNQISNIINEDFSDLSEDYVLTMNTHDKRDRPIATMNLGNWDLRRMALQGKMSRITRYAYRFHETLVQQVCELQENGKNVTRAVTLTDMDGYNFFQHSCPSCVSFQVKLITEIQSHYPNFWEQFISINTPSLFNLVMNAAGGLITPEFKETLILIGHEKNKWMKYLDDRIDRDQRYRNFGGTL